jgi:hypothetical protein
MAKTLIHPKLDTLPSLISHTFLLVVVTTAEVAVVSAVAATTGDIQRHQANDLKDE